MKELNVQELRHISGGISFGLLGGIIAGAVFLASVIYGFINPNKCN